jgi:hypothetical protein
MARHPNPHLPYESYFPGISPALFAPINKDVPYVSQNYTVMNCTMGNWAGDPDTYAYQWKLNGTNAGTNSPNYTIAAPADVGKTATCVVTATNLMGSTAAPPSVGVVIATPAAPLMAVAAGDTVPAPEMEPPPEAQPQPEIEPEPEDEPEEEAPEPGTAAKPSRNAKSRK